MNLSRSIALIDPSKVNSRINILGMGATGSAIFSQLLHHGVFPSSIHIYDFDTVSDVNIGNQIYSHDMVGLPKVEAAKVFAERNFGYVLPDSNIHNVKVDENNIDEIQGIVFFTTDGKRKPLFELMQYKTSIPYVIETGIDSRCWTANLLSFCNPEHIEWFENNRCFSGESSDVTEVLSACGGKQIIKSTVDMCASNAMWLFIQKVNNDITVGKTIWCSCSPLLVRTKDI